MVDKLHIRKLAEEFASDKEFFIVDIKVSTTNRITILADCKGGISIDECATLSKFIESKLDRENEDFDLQVSSPGLGNPFLVKEQYEIHEGTMVKVVALDGKRYKGKLQGVTAEGFDLFIEGKGKNVVKKPQIISFGYKDVRSVKAVIVFK